MTTLAPAQLQQQFEGSRLAVAAYAAADIKTLLSTNPSTHQLSAGEGVRSFAQTFFGSLTVVYNTKGRLFKPDSTVLSELNQQLLRVLYGPHVHSGMLLIKAKRLMMEELVDCFNAKGA